MPVPPFITCPICQNKIVVTDKESPQYSRVYRITDLQCENSESMQTSYIVYCPVCGYVMEFSYNIFEKLKTD